MEYIKENLEKIRARIEAAAKRAGRDSSEITLVAVSKTKPVEMVEAAIAALAPSPVASPIGRGMP